MKRVYRWLYRNKKVLSIEQYFSMIDSGESLFPCLDPHPGIESLKGTLGDIREYPDMSNVLIVIDAWNGNVPISNHVLTVGKRVSPEETAEFAEWLGLLSSIDRQDTYNIKPAKGEQIGIIYAGAP